MTHKAHLLRWFGILLLAVTLFSPSFVYAGWSVDDEFEFATGLIKLGLSDYAQKVVDRVLVDHPDAKDRAKVIQAKILLAKGKAAEAEAIAATMDPTNPKAQAIRLDIADMYYNLGDIDKAKELYESHFSRNQGAVPTDPDLLKSFRDASYKFGRMLEGVGDLPNAIRQFERVIASKPEKAIERQLKVEVAELLVQHAETQSGGEKDKSLNRARELSEGVIWQGFDIWFGRALSMVAAVELAKGNRAKAAASVKQYFPDLKALEKSYKAAGVPLSQSPMASARYLLGEIYEGDGDSAVQAKDKAGAIDKFSKAAKEYINVYIKYADSDWGPKAGGKIEDIKTKLSKLGKELKFDTKGREGKISENEYKQADNLFRQKKFAEAAESYTALLNQYPQVAEAPRMIKNMAQCYRELNDPLMVRMLAEYLGERFSGNKEAGKAMVQLGKGYFDKKDFSTYIEISELYIKYFPKHQYAGATLFTMSNLAKKQGDLLGAADYLKQIIDNYPKDKLYPRALSSGAWALLEAKQYEDAASAFTKYIAVANPGYEKARAQYFLGDSLQKSTNWIGALKAYNSLVKWLEPKDSPYHTSTEVRMKNNKLLETASFLRGYAFTKIGNTEGQKKSARVKAVEHLTEFMQKYPESKLAPKAMSTLGAIKLAQDDFDGAEKMFSELAKKYKDSAEGKSAQYSLIKAAAEIEKWDVAKKAFQDMLSNKAAYGDREFLLIGNLLNKNTLPAEAMQAFQEARSKTQNDTVLQHALIGIGRSASELKQHEVATGALEELMEKFDRTPLFYDAKFLMAESYRQTGNIEGAKTALGDIFKYSDDKEKSTMANIQYGLLQREEGNEVGALASFLRVTMFASDNEADPKVRNLVEEALLEGIASGVKVEKWDDIIELCDQYLKLYPRSKKIAEIRRIKSDARFKAAGAE